jgi:hypothetical protein
MYKIVRVFSGTLHAKRFWRVILRYLSFVALAILLLLACWFAVNIMFTHPADAAHHVETLADLQCTLETIIVSLSLFCLLGGGLAAWWGLLLGQHGSEEGARHYFCGWHSSSYKESLSLARVWLTARDSFAPRALILGR